MEIVEDEKGGFHSNLSVNFDCDSEGTNINVKIVEMTAIRSAEILGEAEEMANLSKYACIKLDGRRPIFLSVQAGI